MAEFQAGEVVVPVVPDASGFVRDLKKNLVPGAYKLGQDLGKEVNRGIQDSLKGVYEPIREQTRRQQAQAPRDGAQVGGAFAQGFRRAVEAGVRALPKIELNADSSDAQRKIQELRARMETLSSKTIGIDIDAGAAQSEVAAIQRELSALDGKRVAADVRVDIASALAELSAVDAALSRIDGQTARARVDVDISGALGAIGIVSAALAGLAAIPVGATLGAGLLSLVGPLGTVGAGFAGVAAVAIPSLGRINEALKAQEQAATGAAAGVGRAAAATRNLVIEQAQAQIRTLQAANAADQLRSAQDRVKSATAGVADAKKRLQQAVQSAASAQSAAAQRAAAAERSLADAQKQALRAQEALNKARKDAIKYLQDVARSIRSNALDQREAALDLREAEKELNAARAKGSPEAIERAEIAYERAQIRVESLRDEQERLQEEQAKGVEGNDRVVAAKEAVERANERVIEQERALAKAYEEAGKAGEDAAKRVADARKAVKDAEKRVDDAKRALEAFKRQQKIAQLQEKIRQEQAKQQAKAAAAAARQPSAAQNKAATAFADLSPAEKEAAKQIEAFKKAYEDFSKDLSAAVLPVITSGLKVIEALFKPITPLIEATSGALVDLNQKAEKALGGKFWKTFFKDMSDAAPRATEGLGNSIGNLVKGVAGLIQAFLPFTDSIVGGLEKATKAFADWAAGLGQSESFKAFLDYAREVAPKVGELFKNLWDILVNLLKGLSGTGSGALDILNKVTGAIAGWSPETLRNITLAILGVVAAFKTWKIIMTTVDGVKKSIQTVSDVAGGAKKVWGGISDAATKAWGGAKKAGAGIAAAAKTAGSATARGATAAWTGITVAAGKAGTAAKAAGLAIAGAARTAATAAVSLGAVALQYARIAVQSAAAAAKQLLFAAAQNAIKIATAAWTAAQWLLNAAMSANPIGIVIAVIVALVAAVVLAWKNSETFRNVVTKAWEAIKLGVKIAWENVIKPALQALWNFITNTLAPKVLWFHNTIVKPAFDKIGGVIKWTWENLIKPALNAVWKFITETLGPKILWLHVNVVKPAFDKIGEVIKFTWERVIKPALDFLHKTIFETIPDGFRKGVGMIETAWNKVKEVARKPVEFIVNTVYNNGIAKVWNAVADTLKLPKLPTVAFAKGGIYPGYTPGRDIGLAAVSGGEAIMRPEFTRAVGQDFIHGANAAARGGGVGGVARFLAGVGDPGSVPGFAGGFAGGGIVGDIQKVLAGGIRAGATTLLSPLIDQAKSAMGDSPWGQMLANVPRVLINGVINFLGGKEDEQGGPGAGKAIAAARSQIGVPYSWGGGTYEGPSKGIGRGANTVGFDCSSLVGYAWYQATGKKMPGASRPTTHSILPWMKRIETPVPGAMGFPSSEHMWLYTGTGKIIEAPYTGAKVREVAARTASTIGMPAFDSGGFLMPGTSLVHNGTGRPEPVLTDQQWQSIAGRASGGDGPMLQIDEFNAYENQSPQQIARELAWLSKER